MPKAGPLPTYRDDLAGFAGILRKQIFSSQEKAAAYFQLHRSTIARYESEEIIPPLGYLACLAQHVSEGREDVVAAQESLLKSLNQAIRHHYAEEGPCQNWAEVRAVAEAYQQGRTRSEQQPSVEPDKPSPSPAQDASLPIKTGLTFARFLQVFQLRAEFTPHPQLKLPPQADQLVKEIDFVGLKWSSLFGFTVALVWADELSEADIKRISQNFFAFNDFLYLKNPKGLKVSRLAWWVAFTLAGVICFVFEQGCTETQLEFVRGQRKESPAYDRGLTEWWVWQNNATSFSWGVDLRRPQVYQQRGKLPDGSNYHAKKTVSELEHLAKMLQEIMRGK